jgi:hypothetical protein
VSKNQKRKKKLKERTSKQSSFKSRLFPLVMAASQVKEQICGSCQACCEVVGVHELNKPTYTKCEHQCQSGCGIYEQRPPSCASYYCLYQAGIFGVGDEMRPDNLGVIFDFRTTKVGDAIGAWEVWENAADELHVVKLIEQLAEKFVVYIRRYNSNKRLVFGPPNKLLALGHIIEEI